MTLLTNDKFFRLACSERISKVGQRMAKLRARRLIASFERSVNREDVPVKEYSAAPPSV